MFHPKMKKIIDIFKKEVDGEDDSYWFADTDNDFQMFDYMDLVSVSFDPPAKNKKDTPVCLTFYSGCPPTFASFLTRVLYKNGVTDFEVMENQYPCFDENGHFKDMLYGDEADDKYEEGIYKKVRNKKYQNFESKGNVTEESKEDQKIEETKIG
jgi:hypothetical protein